nr:hypothetical protein [Tanacetum cinerariifolium]
SGVETPLFEGMLAAREIAEEGIAEEQVQADNDVVAAVQETAAEDVANEAIPSIPTPLILPSLPSHDIPSTPQVQSSPPQQPQSSPQALPQGVKFQTYLFQQVLDTCSTLTRHVENLEHDKAAQNLEIIKLKARVKRLERANKDDSEVQKVVEVVTTAKLITKVVTAATSQVSATSATISAAKPSIPAAALTVVAAYTRRRKGVIIRYPEEELSFKTPAKTPKLKDKGKAQKAAKRRKLNEEAQKVKDLNKHLEVVNDEDDDVFIEATPLARKVPVVDYQIVLINNKPRFKIIKADETHQLYMSFITLLKNFNREDLENLWGIVKERFLHQNQATFLMNIY